MEEGLMRPEAGMGVRQGWEYCREEPSEAARDEDQLTSWSLQKEQALLTP